MWRQAGSHPSSQKDTIALEETLLWVNNLSETEYVDDALILAGGGQKCWLLNMNCPEPCFFVWVNNPFV